MNKQLLRYLSLIPALTLGACANLTKPDFLPMADIHLHFNWDQEELVSAQEAIQLLRDHNVVLAVVTSTPAANAVKLRKAGGDWIYPILSPYLTGYSRNNWFRDDTLLVKMRKMLQTGQYYGIGEVHSVVGLGPARDSKVFSGLVKLADEFDVPMLLHTEASSYKYFEKICTKFPRVRFLWAHAGGILGPVDSETVLEKCSNVWIEMSARDPHHYGSFLNKDGTIPTQWLRIFKKYPDRFMTGTDPVWKAQELHRWDRADEGWLHYSMFNKFHRDWLEQLPVSLGEKIRLTNAQKFWRTKPAKYNFL